MWGDILVIKVLAKTFVKYFSSRFLAESNFIIHIKTNV